jgi:hypothetical protein
LNFLKLIFFIGSRQRGGWHFRFGGRLQLSEAAPAWKAIFHGHPTAKQKNVLLSDRVFPRLQSTENSAIPKNGDEAGELKLARKLLFAKIRSTKQINLQ